ncbi:MAG: serine/threonine protein kinase [Myxococcales bacterium]|nr:serine/threonine protein kinase [Myxococcales bacterium]
MCERTVAEIEGCVEGMDSPANYDRRSRYAASVADAHSFGRYRVTKPLGSGAMGLVYEAIDDVLGREVAIKTLKSSNGMAARLLDDRFRQEARAIAQLSHPGVVAVFDIDLTADPPYLVMERVAGPSLDARLAQGPLSAAELIPLGIQIARALAAAHAAGIVHRDVKPANILAAGPDTWKLADFGVAHVPDSSLTITGQFVGSPGYASPEALVKGISEGAGDVYALGATLYEAIAGRWPRLEKKGALLAPVPPLREIAPHVPHEIAAAIDRAVSFEADARPSAAELAQLLAHAAGAASASVGEAVRPPPSASIAGANALAASEVAPIGSLVESGVSSAVSMPSVPRQRQVRWLPWAIGGAIVLAILLGVALRGGPRDSRTSPAALPSFQLPSETPGEIHVLAPDHMDKKAAKEWNRIVGELHRQHYSSARHRLDEWEHRFGVTPETEDLRRQIDALPPELLAPDSQRHEED